MMWDIEKWKFSLHQTQNLINNKNVFVCLYFNSVRTYLFKRSGRSDHFLDVGIITITVTRPGRESSQTTVAKLVCVLSEILPTYTYIHSFYIRVSLSQCLHSLHAYMCYIVRVLYVYDDDVHTIKINSVLSLNRPQNAKQFSIRNEKSNYFCLKTDYKIVRISVM